MEMMTNSINASKDKIEETMNPFDNRFKYNSLEDRMILPNFDNENELNTLRLLKSNLVIEEEKEIDVVSKPSLNISELSMTERSYVLNKASRITSPLSN